MGAVKGVRVLFLHFKTARPCMLCLACLGNLILATMLLQTVRPTLKLLNMLELTIVLFMLAEPTPTLPQPQPNPLLRSDDCYR